MSFKRLVLSEELVDTNGVEITLPEDNTVLTIVNPEEPTLVADDPVITMVSQTEDSVIGEEEIAVNAYTDMIQDLLRKQWDVINAADGIMATLSSETASTGVNKEDVITILKALVDDSTKSVGMITKALGVIDQKQEDLMSQGKQEAEILINQNESETRMDDISVDSISCSDCETLEPIEESKKPLTEDVEEVDFSNLEYYKRYWAEECHYALESIWDEWTDDRNQPETVEEEEIANAARMLDALSVDEIKHICISAYDKCQEFLPWDDINDAVHEATQDTLVDYANTLINTPAVTMNIGSDAEEVDKDKEGE